MDVWHFDAQLRMSIGLHGSLALSSVKIGQLLEFPSHAVVLVLKYWANYSILRYYACLQVRMFDICPCRTNSKASRFLMYSLPVHTYWFDDAAPGHVNLTLQALMDIIVADLNKLALSGLEHDGQAPEDKD